MENCCEHEGLRLEMERMALEPGLMGMILVAMVVWREGQEWEGPSGRGNN